MWTYQSFLQAKIKQLTCRLKICQSFGYTLPYGGGGFCLAGQEGGGLDGQEEGGGLDRQEKGGGGGGGGRGFG